MEPGATGRGEEAWVELLLQETEEPSHTRVDAKEAPIGQSVQHGLSRVLTLLSFIWSAPPPFTHGAPVQCWEALGLAPAPPWPHMQA